jgi:hypothetical protein
MKMNANPNSTTNKTAVGVWAHPFAFAVGETPGAMSRQYLNRKGTRVHINHTASSRNPQASGWWETRLYRLNRFDMHQHTSKHS